MEQRTYFNSRWRISPYAVSVLQPNALVFANLISHSQVIKRRDLANWFEKIGRKYLRPHDTLEKTTIDRFITTLQSSLVTTTRLYKIQSALNIQNKKDGNLTSLDKYSNLIRTSDYQWLLFEVEIRNIFLAFRYNNWNQLITSSNHNPTEDEKLHFRLYYHANQLLEAIINCMIRHTNIMEDQIQQEEVLTNGLKVS